MVNKVILIGNVGADPDVKYLEGGVAVANIRLATTERFKKNGENVEQTEWHSIVLWRGLAEIVEKYVSKGMRIYIEGRIRTRSWEDQTGTKRYTTEIYADTMQMLSFKQDSNSSGENSSNSDKSPASDLASPQTEPSMPTDESDDLPF